MVRIAPAMESRRYGADGPAEPSAKVGARNDDRNPRRGRLRRGTRFAERMPRDRAAVQTDFRPIYRSDADYQRRRACHSMARGALAEPSSSGRKSKAVSASSSISLRSKGWGLI